MKRPTERQVALAGVVIAIAGVAIAVGSTCWASSESRGLARETGQFDRPRITVSVSWQIVEDNLPLRVFYIIPRTVADTDKILAHLTFRVINTGRKSIDDLRIHVRVPRALRRDIESKGPMVNPGMIGPDTLRSERRVDSTATHEGYYQARLQVLGVVGISELLQLHPVALSKLTGVSLEAPDDDSTMITIIVDGKDLLPVEAHIKVDAPYESQSPKELLSDRIALDTRAMMSRLRYALCILGVGKPKMKGIAYSTILTAKKDEVRAFWQTTTDKEFLVYRGCERAFLFR